MNFYAYCLSADAPDALENLSGVAGARPVWLEQSGLYLVVSEYSGEQVRVSRENVLAHERVTGQVLAQSTPLPFRFGTVATQARLLGYLEQNAAQLSAQLARVRGCVEMSVKVLWPLEDSGNAEAANPIAPEVQQSAGAVSATERGVPQPGPGTSFLAAKRRELLGGETREKRVAEIARWLTECLGETVRETSVTLQPNESLVLRAAHLVERERVAEYRARVQQARAERPGLHFLTSGAWPPYSFAEVRS